MYIGVWQEYALAKEHAQRRRHANETLERLLSHLSIGEGRHVDEEGRSIGVEAVLADLMEESGNIRGTHDRNTTQKDNVSRERLNITAKTRKLSDQDIEGRQTWRGRACGLSFGGRLQIDSSSFRNTMVPRRETRRRSKQNIFPAGNHISRPQMEIREAKSDVGADTPRSSSSSRSNFSAPNQRPTWSEGSRQRLDSAPWNNNYNSTETDELTDKKQLLRKKGCGMLPSTKLSGRWKPNTQDDPRPHEVSHTNVFYKKSQTYDASSVAHLLRAERRARLHRNRPDLKQFWMWEKKVPQNEVRRSNKIDMVKAMQALYHRAAHAEDVKSETNIKSIKGSTQFETCNDDLEPSNGNAFAQAPQTHSFKSSREGPLKDRLTPSPVNSMRLTESHLSKVAKYFLRDNSQSRDASPLRDQNEVSSQGLESEERIEQCMSLASLPKNADGGNSILGRAKELDLEDEEYWDGI